MSVVRRLVATGLAARHAAGIKVRQPLKAVTIAERPLDPGLEAILLEELNIKSAHYQGEGGGLTLDTEITEELKLEGLGRDIVRTIQELRKKCGFAVDDRIRLYYEGDGVLARAFERGRDYIAAETLAVQVERGSPPDGACSDAVRVEGEELQVSVLRVASR
jgi:isoleucyl-tRNA synthetase